MQATTSEKRIATVENKLKHGKKFVLVVPFLF
jgi:hypothetical protein